MRSLLVLVLVPEQAPHSSASNISADVLTGTAPRWLLQAILVENVAVRREGNVLFLPAGPAFRIDHEIKNVVTVVAKTTHYWREHRTGGMDDALVRSA